MKRRLIRWIIFNYIRYIPSTSNLIGIEAKRLTSFFVTKYDMNQQFLLLEEIKHNLIEHRKAEIEAQEIAIEDGKQYLIKLKNNLDKLVAE